MNCGNCSHLHTVEAQVLRLGNTTRKLLYLLRNVRDDGELISAQRQEFERLETQCDAILTGQLDELYGLTEEERQRVAEFLHDHIGEFVTHMEDSSQALEVLRRLRCSDG